jgi:hypothetical protein
MQYAALSLLHRGLHSHPRKSSSYSSSSSSSSSSKSSTSKKSAEKKPLPSPPEDKATRLAQLVHYVEEEDYSYRLSQDGHFYPVTAPFSPIDPDEYKEAERMWLVSRKK